MTSPVTTDAAIVWLAMNIYYDANILFESGTRAMVRSKFKYGSQLYRMNQLLETAELQEELMNGAYRPKPAKKFPINERGHARFISSAETRDKAVNHATCDFVLTPATKKYLIYDNTASQEGKGVSMERKRLAVHLRREFARTGGNKSEILLMDFSGYYASLDHKKNLEQTEDLLIKSGIDAQTRETTMKLLELNLQTYALDVSRFTDAEIEEMSKKKIDPMLNYRVRPDLLTGEKFLRKGADIGAQPSQIFGIIYPYRYDNFAKIVKGVKGYARYTDDSYAIGERKRLKELYEGLSEIAKERELLMNDRKTRICKVSQKFQHLQVYYRLTETGKVQMRMKSVARERRKLKTYKKMLMVGRIKYATIENAFKSWIGTNYKYMTWRQIYSMGTLYFQLYGRRPRWKKKHSRLCWMMAHRSKAWK